jgi:hypothetical protein
MEMIEFVKRVRRRVAQGVQAVIEEFPDIAGAAIDREAAVGVYGRFADEAIGVLTTYPRVAAVL